MHAVDAGDITDIDQLINITNAADEQTAEKTDKQRLRDFVGFGCAGRCVGHDVTRIARAAKLSVLVNP